MKSPKDEDKKEDDTAFAPLSFNELPAPEGQFSDVGFNGAVAPKVKSSERRKSNGS